jgi:hypothetical protein
VSHECGSSRARARGNALLWSVTLSEMYTLRESCTGGRALGPPGVARCLRGRRNDDG